MMPNQIARFQVLLRNHLPGFAQRQCASSNSSRTQSCMSWIRCSNLLNRGHLLLISCSRSDHCGRWLFRSSWPTINVNQASKTAVDEPTVLWVMSRERKRFRSCQGKFNMQHCVSSRSITDQWLFLFVCAFFNRRVLILWTILCCTYPPRLTLAQGKAVWRQRMGAHLLFFLNKGRITFQIHAVWFSTN